MPTLYEDWKQRRARLTGFERTLAWGDQAHVLDFLLANYADNPAAQRPARVFLGSVLKMDCRAIVVHAHLGRGLVNAVRTPEEAHSRARRLLSHIAEINPQEVLGPPGHTLTLHPKAAPSDSSRTLVSTLLNIEFSRSIAELAPGPVVAACNRLLRDGRTLPEHVVRFLIDCLRLQPDRDPDAIFAVLVQCENESAQRFLVDEALGRGLRYSDAVAARLTAYIERRRQRVAEMLREGLCDGNLCTRLRAAEWIGSIGEMEDIALLEDLLALPEVRVVDLERDALVKAMRALAGMNTPVPATCEKI